jgi:putative transposase
MPTSERALWRFSLIAPLLHRAAGVSLTAMARQLATEVKTAPTGELVLVAPETLLRWLRRYEAGGVPALEDQVRSDRGTSRALSAELVRRIQDLADDKPAWTVAAIHRHLQRELGRAVPIKPIYRLLKGRRRTPPGEAHRKRPVGIPQILWLADTMHGPAVYGPRRKKRKSYLIAIFDDASRLVVGSAFTTADTTEALMPILREAVLARGLPHRLLVDNGPNYRSRALRTVSAHLGIHLVHAAPYRATAKARLERFFLTVRLQFIPRLPAAPTLEGLNTEWARFVAEYHDRPHTALTEHTGRPTSPMSYYLRFLPPDVRYVDTLAIEDFFLIEATRRVRPDGTIRLASRYWEVDAHLVGDQVLVRYNPNDPKEVRYRLATDAKAAFQAAALLP